MNEQTVKQIQSKDDRDALLKDAEVTREQGDLETALTTFLTIKEWDEQNDTGNPKRSAVFGHIRITYARMAMHEPVSENKLEFLNLAKQAAQDGLSVLSAFPNETGLIATMQIHAAGSSVDLAEFLEADKKSAELLAALSQIDQAIQNLPGSEAHKAWPIRTKTEILRKLGRFEEATQTALSGFELIFRGYVEELEKDAKAAELKLLVWTTGLHLELARIAKDQNKLILANYFAELVVNTTDPTGTLNERKREAQELLTTLSG